MRTTAKGQVVFARKARRGNLAGGPGYVGLSSGSTGDLGALYFEALHSEPPPYCAGSLGPSSQSDEI